MDRPPIHAVILADGAVPSRARLDAAWPGWDSAIGLVVAADGGARHADPLALRLDRWVGDGDSIDPAALDALAASGVAIRRVDEDKDESDTEIALLECIAEGAVAVTFLGALGGVRIDHALANVGLLEHPALAGRRATLYDDRATRISVLSGARDLAGRVGDLVTLLPLGGAADGVVTDGLRFPLLHESLAVGRSRGLSNVRTAPVARVSLDSGRLLVIETPATLPP